MKIGKAELLHIDCMEYMSTLPDKAFGLAIVDPPYGVKMDGGKTYQRPSRPNEYGKEPKHVKKDWDRAAPSEDYFLELFRVSANIAVCGANYFSEFLPSSSGWIFWDKDIGGDFSDGELIFTSQDRALRKFTCHPFVGTNGGKDRIHPTQKPVKLYEWLLANYAKPGQRILDTHLGSGSSAIACNNLGFEMVGCELDEDYYKAACNRIQKETEQMRLFA